MRRRREISGGILASRGCCWVGVGTDCMFVLRTENVGVWGDRKVDVVGKDAE